MISGLREVASGLYAQQQSLDVISNNIANAQTPGFKKSRAEFEDLLYEAVRPEAQKVNLADPSEPVIAGDGVRVSLGRVITLQGDIRPTDRPLDIAIVGEGYFEVTMPDGAKAYTRSGSFTLDPDGRIVTGNGEILEGVTVPLDAESLVIREDGTVSVQRAGEEALEEIGSLPLVKFQNPSGLESIGGSLFVASPASGVAEPWDANSGKVLQSYLEASNVDYAEEITRMITAQRAYQLAARCLASTDNMLSLANQLRI